MSNLLLDLEIAETLGINVALLIALARKENITDLAYLKSLGIEELKFVTEKEINLAINKISKFNLLKQIEDEQYLKPPTNKNTASAMTNNWRPAREVFEVVKFAGISKEFVESLLPEFRLYWTEKKILKDNWNKILIDHIRREWATNSLPNKGLPFPIDDEWQPSQEVFDVLEMGNISQQKALSHLKPFILFWKDSGRAFKSWNSKFVEFVRRKELSDNDISDFGNENLKRNNEAGDFSQKFDKRIQDKSWAEEIDLK
ncbi:MAG: DnaT-like ssDNA-binding domain-containing protein [Gammaproteobacteria bacterium]